MRRILISAVIIMFFALPLLAEETGGDAGAGADAATSGSCKVNLGNMGEGLGEDLDDDTGGTLIGDTDGDGVVSDEERALLTEQQLLQLQQQQASQGGQTENRNCDEEAAADGSINCYCPDGTATLCQEVDGVTSCPPCP